MASSFSRKSNSSASRAPKPTYRRASGASRSQSNMQPSTPRGSAPAARPAGRPSVSRSTQRVSSASKTAAGASRAAARSASKPVAVKRGRDVVQRPRMSAPGAGHRVPVGGGRGATAKTQRPSARGATAAGRSAPGARPVASPSMVRAVSKQKIATGSQGPAPKPAPGILKSGRPVVAKSSIPAKVSMPPKDTGHVRSSGIAKSLRGVSSAFGSFWSSLWNRLNLPRVNRSVFLTVVGAAVVIGLVAIVVTNSPLLAIEEVQVKGTEHVEQTAAQALIDVPKGSTLVNVDERAIVEQLQASPWIADATIERSWPHALVVTPVERKVRAIAYITSDEIAWAIGEDGTWIAPLTLLAAVDGEGNEVDVPADGTVPEGATLLAGQDAALRIAQDTGCVLFVDVPSDVNPKSGKVVSSKVIQAALDYAKGFSSDFLAQVKSLSVPSVEAISANLTSGVEVSLGAPENIIEKERVVTKLLSQETGVTFINVREPGAYTFRSAPQ